MRDVFDQRRPRRIVRMLLNRGTLEGHRLLEPATVKEMWDPGSDGRMVGRWGGRSALRSRRRCRRSSRKAPSAHLGFTGTAVWIDRRPKLPDVLSNRVHPYGGGASGIRDLRIRVAAAAGARCSSRPSWPIPGPISGPAADGRRPTFGCCRAALLPAGALLTGLDVLPTRSSRCLSGHAVVW